MRVWLGLVLLIVVLLPAQVSAARLALVIGIDAYDNLPPLDRAVGDADAMSRALEQLGFSVAKVINPARREFNQAITDFRRALKPGDSAFVHYSGHGVEVNGQNLLLPRDIPIPTNGDEDFLIAEAIDLQTLMERIAESGADVRIFVVDACRNNPFARKGVRGLGEAGGLAMSAPPNGSFVLYSAGFRQTALDRLGPDDAGTTSVYTRALIEQLAVPGASISQIARSVRTDVAELALSVGHEQSPAYYDELSKDFVIGVTIGTVPASAEADAVQAFDRAQQIGTQAAWEAFLKNYPDGVYADLAHAAMLQLPAGLPPKPAKPDALLSPSEARQQLEGMYRESRRLMDAGEETMSDTLTDKALELALLYFGPDSLEYAEANNHLVASPYGSADALNRAIVASRTAVDIYTRHFGAKDVRVLTDKSNLASRLGAAGNKDEAVKLYEEIITAYEAKRLSVSDKLYYAHALEGYSQVLARNGEMERGLQYAQSAVAVIDALELEPSIDLGWITMNYGQILIDAGQCKAAMAVLQRARDHMAAAGVATAQHDHATILGQLEQGM